MSWAALVAARLDEVRAAGRWRRYRDLDVHGPRGLLVEDGRPIVTFASNDYLGLSAHPEVEAAATAAIDRWGTGAGGSRLITGARPIHRELEAELANWKGTDRAVLFPTGFAANLGVLTALGIASTRIVSDERNHASIIDGTRLARAEVAVWRHGDLDELTRLLTADDRPTIVVADTVFSMDGDVLDVAAVADRCRATGALLVLDEAHAALGPHPTADALTDVEVVRVGTLSKTLGALGGFAACSGPVADLLVNTARSSIFTTALSPADAAAALAALRVVRSPDGDALVARLRGHVDRLRPGHPSPIVPIIVGDEDEAVTRADRLLELGLHVPAIRPPTVAPGTSRLRVTLSAAHTDEEIDRLLTALSTLADGTTTPTPPHPSPAAATGAGAVPSGPHRDRPRRLVLVVGTATDVGKTWVGGEVLGRLRAGGATVAARKPAQSFDPDDDHPTDAEVLGAATGEEATTVCPAHRSYEVPMAPPMAADALGRTVPTIDDLLDEVRWPAPAVDVGWFETVGGPRSPIGDDGDAVTVADRLDPDVVVLVADAGLGTVNAVLVSLAPFEGRRVVVLLNRYDGGDDLHRRNLDRLRTREGLEIVTDPEALTAVIAGR